MAEVFVFKEIKSERFKDEAFRDEIVAAVEQAAKDLLGDFEKTTATWNRKPDFDKLTDENPPAMLVSTDDEIYQYVDKGTEPHLIFAGAYTGKSDKKALAFPRSSTPKTKPRVIGSSPGARSSEKVVRPYVHHPGTEPRHFEEEIGKKWKKLFKRRMERAMSSAAKKSNYSE